VIVNNKPQKNDDENDRFTMFQTFSEKIKN